MGMEHLQRRLMQIKQALPAPGKVIPSQIVAAHQQLAHGHAVVQQAQQQALVQQLQKGRR